MDQIEAEPSEKELANEAGSGPLALTRRFGDVASLLLGGESCGDNVLGHESLGRVEEAPRGSGFAPGDLVVGVVRRPDPIPCPACAAGEWDMCRNGSYTERAKD